MSKDILLAELGTGGEMVIEANDIVLTESLFQMIYLALFGGNIEASTTGNELPSELRYDWWGNELLFGEVREVQFNSETERVLKETVLNTSGRTIIERAVEYDLQFLNQIADYSVEVSLETYNRVEIMIKLQRLDNQQEKIYQLVYDNAKDEVIVNKEL